MAKVLVELKEGSLLDLIGKQYIMSGKPCVANISTLVESTIAKGDMKLIARLKEDASEEALAKAKDIKEFLAKFDADKVEEPKKPEENKGNTNSGSANKGNANNNPGKN